MDRHLRSGFAQKKEEPKYLGIYAAANYCNICYRHFMNAVRSGRIPYRCFGKATYRFSREALDEFMRGSDHERKQSEDEREE